MFIVFEGLDGSGKSTQANMLSKYLEDKGLKTKLIHFPDTESPVYGELIGKFLRGELGSLDKVDPHLTALLYAGDRNNAKKQIEEWIEQGYVVIADRYVYSNVAFQAAKLGANFEQELIAKWILEMEYEYFKIPKPDLNIFLDVPTTFTQKQLSTKRDGEDRAYLKGQVDIHEADLTFQQKVRSIYMGQLVLKQEGKLVNCANPEQEMSSPEEVFAKVLPFIEELNIN